MEHFDNTICAPATAPGGAIAVIRVSGLHAIRCADRIFKGRTPLASARGYSMHFGSILESDGTLLDEVLVSVFRAPRSYTGENAVVCSRMARKWPLLANSRNVLSCTARWTSPRPKPWPIW